MPTLDTFELSPGVWRVTVPLRHGVLGFNTYILKSPQGVAAVDAGPAIHSGELLSAISSIVPISHIRWLVLLDDSPHSLSGANAWRKAGFRGEIIANWRVVFSAGEAGVQGPFLHVHNTELVFPSTEDALFDFRIFQDYPSFFYALHRPSNCLFTGKTASSMGQRLPAIADYSASCHPLELFAESLGLPGPSLQNLMNAFSGVPKLVCPRFGSSFPGDAPAAFASTSGRYWCSDLDNDASSTSLTVKSLLGEIDQLRQDNFNLQTAMVTASDAALRDAVSGLYGRSYAEVFLRTLLQQGTPFSAAFIQIDKLKDINRSAGAAEGDRLIGDLANFMQERVQEGYLFRWSGPVFVLAMEKDRESVFREAEALRGGVEDERRFSRPITVSIAIVGSDELPTPFTEGTLSSLSSFGRARLKLMERRGGNNVLAESDEPVKEKAIALVLDGDPISVDFIAEFFNREGFSAISAGRGGAALELMDRYKPEVVVADTFIPQFDAFQVRAKMLDSPDLRDIPFVLLTKGKTDELVARAHALRIFHIFEKPVPLPELMGVVRYLVQRAEDES